MRNNTRPQAVASAVAGPGQGKDTGPLLHRIRLLLPHYRQHARAFATGFLLLLAANGSAAAVPYLMKLAADALAGQGPLPVWACSILLVIMAVLNGWFRLQSRVQIFRIGRQVEYALRAVYHARLQELGSAFFDREKTGDLVSRGTNDITAVRMFIGPGFLQLSNTAMVYCTIIPVMLAMDPLLTLAALAPMPLALIAARWLSHRLYRLSRAVADRFGQLSGFVQEAISGMTVVRAYAQEENWRRRFTHEGEEFYQASLRHARLQGTFGPMMVFSGGLGTWVILFLAGEQIMRGALTVGDFVAFTGYLSLLIWPTVGFGWILTVLQRGLAALARIQAVVDQSADTGLPTVATNATEPDPVPAWMQHPEIRIQNLSFAYPVQGTAPTRPVLQEISLVVPGGSFIGIVGRIGCGKTTLLECLAALRPVPPNSLTYAGRPIETLDETTVRQLVTMVPQESFLFSRTLLDNILYGLPAMSAVDGEAMAWDAARSVGLDEEIARFPQGMQTVIGERGITLSGGQRQRVALARAMVTQAPVLLLDDIFSHVDAATEERILSHLRDILQQRTVVMVCHRLASLRLADAVVVLDQGRMVAHGSHSQLLEHSPLYLDLHHRMARREALEALQ